MLNPRIKNNFKPTQHHAIRHFPLPFPTSSSFSTSFFSLSLVASILYKILFLFATNWRLQTFKLIHFFFFSFRSPSFLFILFHILLHFHSSNSPILGLDSQNKSNQNPNSRMGQAYIRLGIYFVELPKIRLLRLRKGLQNNRIICKGG